MLGSVYPVAADNLIGNGGFESDELGQVAMWSMDAYIRNDDAVRFFATTEQAHSGKRSLAIANLQPNDSRAVQWIRVKPDSYYRLSCWVMAWDVETAGVGANISVLGSTICAGDIRDTDGQWQRVEITGKTGPAQESLGVLVRLGFYGSLASGIALFDDMSMEGIEGSSLPKNAVVAALDEISQEGNFQVARVPVQPARRSRVALSPWLLPAAMALLAVLGLGAVAVALVSLTAASRFRSSAAPSFHAAPGKRGKIPIESLLSGFGAWALGSGHRTRGRKMRLDGQGCEHRSWPRSPLSALITVSKGRRDLGSTILRLSSANVSDGGIFLESDDLSLLELDDEVTLQIMKGDAKTDLGKAVVVRAHMMRDMRGRAVAGGFGLRFMEPHPHVEHAIRNISAKYRLLEHSSAVPRTSTHGH
jgi:hypothetical protein